MRAPSRHFVRFRSFVRSRDGAIAPIFAILLALVLIPAVGAAVDLSRIQSSRTHLQDGVDSAALALARLSPSTPNATLVSTATSWINANVKDPNMALNAVSVSSTTTNVTVTAQATVKADLLASIGVQTMQVQLSSTTQWGLSHVEVALVLDNTGSMTADNKLPTLISSAQSLVTTLFSQSSGVPNAVKVSVVPFSMTVNVGSTYQTASWLTGTQPSAYGYDLFFDSAGNPASANRFTLFSQLKTAWGGCVETRPMPYDTQDTAPSAGTPASLFVPFFAPDEMDVSGNGTNDYLTDGSNSSNWLVRQGNPNKYSNTGFKQNANNLGNAGYMLGPNAGCQLAPLLRLSTSQDAVQAELNQMVAVGDTNLAMGLMWGWHTLTPNAPFSDGVAYGTANVQKIVVLLTDGWNESTVWNNYDQSVYSGIGYSWQNRVGFGTDANSALSSSQSARDNALDARTNLVCSNMKAAGITIYTVRIDVASSQSPSVLQSCASSSADFYDVPQVSNLNTAFQAIAGQIGALRVTK